MYSDFCSWLGETDSSSCFEIGCSEFGVEHSHQFVPFCNSDDISILSDDSIPSKNSYAAKEYDYQWSKKRF